MQERLTLWQSYLTATEKPRRNKKFWIAIVSFVLALVILLIILMSGRYKSNVWIEKEEYYFVVVGDNLSLSSALAYKKQIEEAGGAGELMRTNGNGLYSVIIFSYKNKNDAEKVKQSSEEIFPHCYLICKEVYEISQKTQTNIKSVNGVIEAIELVRSLYDSAVEMLFGVEKGEIEYSKLYKFAVLSRDKLARAHDSMGGSDELSVNIRASLLSLETYLDLFIKDGIAGNSSLLHFRKFCVVAMQQVLEINHELLQFG